MLGVIPAFIQDDPDFSASAPLVLVHDGGGATINYYFLNELERPVWGIANESLADEKVWPGGINQLARVYFDLIQTELPRGPIILGGWSVGGLIALAMARLFDENAERPLLGVIMIDTFYPTASNSGFHPDIAAIEWGEATTEESKQITLRSMKNSFKFAQEWRSTPMGNEDAAKLPQIVLLRAKDELKGAGLGRESRILGWEKHKDNFFAHVLDVPGHHYNLFANENVDGLTEVLSTVCSMLEHGVGKHYLDMS